MPVRPEYASLTDAMKAGDALAEAEMRYAELDKSFTSAAPRERKSLSVELNNLMEKITQLRAQNNALDDRMRNQAEDADKAKWGQIVPIDDRFAKKA